MIVCWVRIECYTHMLVRVGSVGCRALGGGEGGWEDGWDWGVSKIHATVETQSSTTLLLLSAYLFWRMIGLEQERTSAFQGRVR